MHYLIPRSHDEITRAGAKELVRMSHRGCCRGGPTAHPLVDLLPLLHPFFGHITTFLTFWLLPLLHLFWTYCHQFDMFLDLLPGFHPFLDILPHLIHVNISPLLINICELWTYYHFDIHLWTSPLLSLIFGHITTFKSICEHMLGHAQNEWPLLLVEQQPHEHQNNVGQAKLKI